jgi:hypothetical protein
MLFNTDRVVKNILDMRAIRTRAGKKGGSDHATMEFQPNNTHFWGLSE